MIRPVEIVGVGSSGLYVIEKFRKLLYTIFQENVPERIIKCVVLETHQGNLQGSDLRSGKVDISIGKEGDGIQEPEDLEEKLENKLDWFEAIGGWEKVNEKRVVTTAGAGGIRPSGKFSLLINWNNVETAVDWALTSAAIQAAEEKIRNFAAQRAIASTIFVNSRQKGIYVVGTLPGGTNSGAFIDLAYLLRRKLNLGMGERICGIFFLPYQGYDSSLGNANVYGALKELEWVSDEGYINRWPDGRIYPWKQTDPYAPVFLIASQSTDQNLQDAYDKVALKLFLDFMGMADDSEGIRTDGTGEINNGKTYLWTFNLGGVAYPKYELVEASACKAGEELCERMLKAEKQAIAYEEGDKALRNRVQERVFQYCLNELTVEGSTFTSLLFTSQDSLATHFSKGILYASDVKNRFDSYEHAVKSDDINIRDRLVESLQLDVQNTFQRSERNLEYTNAFLKGILDGIDNLRGFWQTSRDLADYNSTLDGLKPEGRLYRTDRTKELLQQLADTCIIRALKGHESSGTIWDEAQKDLEEKISIDKRIANVETAKGALEKKREEITNYLKNTDLRTIYKVDRSGNQITTSNAVNDEIERLKRDITIGLDDVWELTGDDKKFASEIKSRYIGDIFPRASAQLNADRLSNLIQNTAQEVQGNRELFRSGVGILSDQNKGRGFVNYFIGDPNIYSRIGFQHQDAQNGNKTYPFLDEIVVCYAEKANFNFKDLAIWDDIQSDFNNSPAKATHLTYPIHDEEALKKLLNKLEKEYEEPQKFTQGEIRDILADEAFQKHFVAFVEGFCCIVNKIGGRWQRLQVSSGLIKNKDLNVNDWLKVNNNTVQLVITPPSDSNQIDETSGIKQDSLPQSTFTIACDENAGREVKEACEEGKQRLFSEEQAGKAKLGDKRPYLREAISKLKKCVKAFGGKKGVTELFNGGSNPDSMKRAENIRAYLKEKHGLSVDSGIPEILGENGFL